MKFLKQIFMLLLLVVWAGPSHGFKLSDNQLKRMLDVAVHRNKALKNKNKKLKEMLDKQRAMVVIKETLDTWERKFIDLKIEPDVAYKIAQQIESIEKRNSTSLTISNFRLTRSQLTHIFSVLNRLPNREKLKGLNFSGINLSDVMQEFKSLLMQMPDVNKLDINNCRLTYLPVNFFSNLKNLYMLNLSNNSLANIDGITFDKLTYLETLNLSGNAFKELELRTFAYLGNLQDLDLSGNPYLSNLPVGIFGGLEKLNKLNLSKCAFADLSNAFICLSGGNQSAYLGNLKVLDLSNNDSLTSIPKKICDFGSLTELYLYGNNNLPLDALNTFTEKGKFKSLKTLKLFSRMSNYEEFKKQIIAEHADIKID